MESDDWLTRLYETHNHPTGTGLKKSLNFALFRLTAANSRLSIPRMKNDSSRSDAIRMISTHQGALLGYILSMHPDRTEAQDILQETNIVVWEKMDQFQMGSNFKAWVFRIAYLQTLAYFKRRRRDHLLGFSSDLIATLAEEADETAEVSDGVFGKSLVFEGDGRYAVSDYPGVAIHRARSVAFWVRLPTESAEFGCNCLLSWGVPEPRQKWEMLWNRSSASGQIGALRVDFGRGYLVGNTDLRDGLWHHIAVVFYGGDHADVTTHLKLYVDGRLETTTGRRPQRIDTSIASDRSIPVTLGRYMDHRLKIPRSYFVGQIDELFIVEGALNPSQIVMLREKNQFQNE